ncbi:MAG: diguanylate cyclase, partial [Epsilonproteobacteria bacterium]|nr:diguanylate cyclase [Campylobacterota bacterium]
YKGKSDIAETMEKLETLSGKQFHPEVLKYAKLALSDIKPQGTINQLPKTDLEKERFSYFYRDQITNVYNADYLKFILNQEYFQKEYTCINILYMHNFSIYNNKYGWTKGDMLLSQIANHLNTNFPTTLIFRIYGDDFVLISKEKIDIDMEQFKKINILNKHKITLTSKYIDLRKINIDDIKDLERLKEIGS